MAIRSCESDVVARQLAPNKDLAKSVILQIIRQAGGRLERTTNLYKAFYFAHLIYAKKHPTSLTNWPIVRMPRGPGIDSGAKLLRELRTEGKLDRGTVQMGPFEAAVYQLTSDPPHGMGLNDDALDAIREAVELTIGKTAAELSDWTHEFSRSWNLAKDGETLDIYLDLIPDDEYEETAEGIGLMIEATKDIWRDAG